MRARSTQPTPSSTHVSTDSYSDVPLEKDSCHPNPCHHGGVCEIDGDDYTCSCTSGWTGLTCEGTKQTSSTKGAFLLDDPDQNQ